MYLRIQKRTSELLSKGNVTDKPSQYVDMILFILILLNVTAVCLESIKDIGETYKDTFYAFEIFSVVISKLTTPISGPSHFPENKKSFFNSDFGKFDFLV